MIGTPEVIAGLVQKVVTKHPFSQITDLGSGSGGPMPIVVDLLKRGAPTSSLKLLLTDRYPNPDTVAEINGMGLDYMRYCPEPVDATKLEAAPEGLKTMIASFHHMPPDSARAILHSAAVNQQPLLIYEIAKNTVPVLVWVIFLPISLLILMLMTWVMTPFVRHITLSQILLTYLIPVIPLVYAWDGQASLMRTYSFSDIEGLLDGAKTPDYQWTVAPAAKSNGKNLGYYILGIPKAI